MSFFAHQGINFYFEQLGTGPVVVFCHGLTGDLTQIHDLLGDIPEYSVLVWDARGHGQTNPVGPREAFSFEQFAADLHALLHHLKIERAVIGGVSMGAAVSVRFALNWPEMVSALVLVRPAWLDTKVPHALREWMNVGNLLERLGNAEGRKHLQQSPEFNHLLTIDAEAARSLLEQFDKPLAADRAFRLQRMPDECPISSWEEVLQLTMPSLVIGCESDYVHPFSYAAEWSQRLPNAQFVKVPAKSINLAAHNRGVSKAIASFLQLTCGKLGQSASSHSKP